MQGVGRPFVPWPAFGGAAPFRAWEQLSTGFSKAVHRLFHALAVW